MQAPVLVLSAQTKRETGNSAQLGNIAAAKAVADIIRTSLGPKAMLKMILSAQGGILITNDGNAILREIEVSHPAAKTMIDLSKTQDEEVGDGTTSVIILAGEILSLAEPFLTRKVHPRIIIAGFSKALDDALVHLQKISIDIDPNNKAQVINVIKSCIGTKFISRWSDLMCSLAYDAVNIVKVVSEGRTEVDIKRYCKIEKIPGGEISDCYCIPGVLLNKDVTHPKMRRRIENPRVVLLDCNLEFKKNESSTIVNVSDEAAWLALLKEEEDFVKKQCDIIIKFKPDLVFTEKGISDLAQHFFVKNNITALRRLKKTDNNRLAKTTGATIVNRPEDLRESDIGTRCTLFEIQKIGDEYYSFITGKESKSCTILLRGATKDVLSEVERNIQDALAVTRNLVYEPKLVPGGGASEMSISAHLTEKSRTIAGVEQWPYHTIGVALEVIPRTLIQNTGANVIKSLTNLKAKHHKGESSTFGIDGVNGTVVDMKELGIWEPFQVKAQTIKTALEAACMLLRVDSIVSGLTNKKEGNRGGAPNQMPMGEDLE
eukprot:TRINITY_DN1012_c0_g1_i2.p1 TRINITY_DN1012_c0_g1~~TRINITY_DN1012_c0_g1_i2.p1  ORF type:complete len:546 (+),score=116.78 TRINITY_DN1012_c0_g1_i2:114-1751(+)